MSFCNLFVEWPSYLLIFTL